MTRRQSLQLISVAVARTARAQPKPRPNFVFILADDHAGYVLGADGNRLASTPHLDHLASRSTRFSAHYCNSPVCTPSRQGLLTGRLPHAAGVTRLPTPLSPESPTLARQFQTAGYRTAVFGKMHFNRPAQPGLHGFDVMLTEGELQRAWQRDIKPRPLPSGIAAKPPWRPFQDPARVWLNAEKLPFPCVEEEMKGAYLANRAIEYLAEQKNAPFALWISFQEPHSPYDFPIEDRNRFDPKRFTVPRLGPGDAWQIPLIFRGLTADEKRGIAASYYTSVSFLDRNIGRVLDKIRNLGLDDNTLVVYTADHGYNLGQHGRFEKHCGYDPSLRVPLLVRFPGRVRTGVYTGLTEHIDLTATITDLMGLDPMPGMQGETLRPLLEGRPPSRPREYIFSEYLENEEAFIRTTEWKYIFCSGRRKRTDGYETDNPTPGRYRRLYNLKRDPGEFTDIAAKHPEVVDRLESAMLDRFRRTHPDREREPAGAGRAEAIEFYLTPRDA